MRDPQSLNSIARHLAAQLDCMQDLACRQILQTLTEIGQPIAPARLATLLQMSQEELAMHLDRVPDTEFDEPSRAL